MPEQEGSDSSKAQNSISKELRVEWEDIFLLSFWKKSLFLESNAYF